MSEELPYPSCVYYPADPECDGEATHFVRSPTSGVRRIVPMCKRCLPAESFSTHREEFTDETLAEFAVQKVMES